MAKVKGPLFSLTASGTFDGKMTFRTGDGGTICAGVRKVSPGRSIAQQAQAQKFGQAITAWRGLSSPTKEAWKSAATLHSLNGYQFFLSEYITQNITPPDLPVIP